MRRRRRKRSRGREEEADIGEDKEELMQDRKGNE